jgi:hypothetical protein
MEKHLPMATSRLQRCAGEDEKIQSLTLPLQAAGGMGLKYKAEGGKMLCYDYMPGSSPTVIRKFT